MPPDELNERLQAIGNLLKLFRAERTVYLSVNILSLAVLLGCAIYLLFRGADTVAVVGLFGSRGHNSCYRTCHQDVEGCDETSDASGRRR
jgi:hypothetical protein